MSEMRGKVCIVTGSNSGIGKETARELARDGATVVMVVRDREKGEAARQEIIEDTGNSDIDIMIADLSSMCEIEKLADEFKNKYDRLDVLINNAGAIYSDRKVTDDGFELTFALNHLAPVYLTHLLLDVLRASSPSRVINVSSGAHRMGDVRLDDLQLEESYGGMKAYSSAKLMEIMATYEMAEKLEGTGITVNAVHPGFVNTNFGKNGGLGQRILLKIASPFQRSPEEGAETSVYLARSPDVDGITGKYYKDCEIKEPSDKVFDTELRKELWAKTEQILGLSKDGVMSFC